MGNSTAYSYFFFESNVSLYDETQLIPRRLFLDEILGENATVGKHKSNDTQVIQETLQYFGGIYLVLTILFCWLRVKYPRLFNIRSWVPGLECEIAKQSQYGYINWVWRVFDIDEEDILEQCGMDALCFIRILRIGRKLSLMGCFNALWLIPVYVTAEKSPETAYLTDRLVISSTSNLPSQSTRFLATSKYCTRGQEEKWVIRGTG
jgi:hypothetical protein